MQTVKVSKCSDCPFWRGGIGMGLAYTTPKCMAWNKGGKLITVGDTAPPQCCPLRDDTGIPVVAEVVSEEPDESVSAEGVPR